MKKRLGFFIKSVTALLMMLLVFSVANTVSAAPSEISDKQKEMYYKKYVEIINDVNAENINANLEIASFDEFEEQDWVKPKEFKKIAIDRVDLKFVQSEPGFSAMVSGVKSKSFEGAGGVNATVNVTGNFNTTYDSVLKRQVFTTVISISSKLGSGSIGTWTPGKNTATRIDGGRTYAVVAGGTYSVNGIKSAHNLAVEFHCSATGGVY